jgi:hypothetical protein
MMEEMITVTLTVEEAEYAWGALDTLGYEKIPAAKSARDKIRAAVHEEGG